MNIRLLMILFAFSILLTAPAHASMMNLDYFDTQIKDSNGNWVEIIGEDDFNNFGMTASGTPSGFTFQLFTNFKPQDPNGESVSPTYGSLLGDLIFRHGSSDKYLYHAFDLSGLGWDAMDDSDAADAGLYEVNTWYYASHWYGYSGQIDGNWIYGTEYRAKDAHSFTFGDDNGAMVRVNSKTQITDDNEHLQATVHRDDDINGGYDGDYVYTISGEFNLLDALGLEWGDSFDVLFATATCANSGMMGTVTTQTPEPGTWLLFGTGLLGLAWLGRKRMAKRS